MMSRTLYLMRHAEAAAKEARQQDRARELTQTGVKDALHMGAWLRDHNLTCDLVICSSAQRAEQTAQMVAEGMKLQQPRILAEDVLYEASVRQLLDYVNNVEDAYRDVILVAHNPAISYFAEYLTKADIGHMPPGGIAILKLNLNSWKEITENSAALERYLTPESIAAM